MQQEIKELDVVALLEDVPEEGLIRGETGTVLEVFEPGVFLVEFSDNLGVPYGMPTLRANQLLLLRHRKASREEVIDMLGVEEAKKSGYIEHEIHSIKDMKVVGDFMLDLTFEDGLTKRIDFSDTFWGELFCPLKDPSYFKQVSLNREVRTIEWPNGADFDPDTLYHWEENIDWFKEKAKEMSKE